MWREEWGQKAINRAVLFDWIEPHWSGACLCLFTDSWWNIPNVFPSTTFSYTHSITIIFFPKYVSLPITLPPSSISFFSLYRPPLMHQYPYYTTSHMIHCSYSLPPHVSYFYFMIFFFHKINFFLLLLKIKLYFGLQF